MKIVTISKKLLAEQYNTMNVRDIAALYGVCISRLYQLLDEAGIERKIKNRAPKREKIHTIMQD